jgi:hypothetical protein
MIDWAVLVGAPTIWFFSFLAGFAIAPLTCPRQSNGLLWLVSIIAFVLVGAATVAARRRWRQDGGWLAIVGTILSAGFCLVIVAQWIPSIILQGCQ